MNDYDPKIPLLRQMLALSIVNKMEECGFRQVATTGHHVGRPELSERVYARTVGSDERLQVRVYTTVIGGDNGVPFEVRKEGKDAIRVCATYKTRDGKTRGLVKETRVNRTGNIDEIVERMYQRMRSSYQAANTCETCRDCGAPKFVTKNNKLCCSEICWKTPEQKQSDEIKFKSKTRKKYRGRRRW